MTMTAGAAVGVRACDGKLMWRYPQVANSTANIATPVYADGKVFYTSNYGTGGALLGLRAAGGGGQGQRDLLHARDAEPSWRRRAGQRHPVRIQQRDPDLPRLRHRKD